MRLYTAPFFRSSSALCLAKPWVGVLVLMIWMGSAAAQEVAWRYDYNSARREAQEKGKPLLVDFSTDPCYWCVKMDTETFRNPTIATLLNERFVPIKVHALNNPSLTEALRIQSFPTNVLAGPDGKILGMLEGYMEASRFHDHLQRALAGLNNPEWMNRDFQAASKAIADSDYSRAIVLLKNIVEDGKKRPIQVKAQQLLQGLEQQAADQLARAKRHMDNAQNSQAMEIVTNLLRLYPGTQAAVEAKNIIEHILENPELKAQQRTRRARELLAQAREDYRTQQYLWCMERCEVLATNFPDLAEGIEAIQLNNEIKNNPEWMQQACENLSDRLGLLYLSLAETWLKKGQPKQAELILERVIQTLPGTRQADAAQVRLAQIQGQPTRAVGFNNKKP